MKKHNKNKSQNNEEFAIAQTLTEESKQHIKHNRNRTNKKGLNNLDTLSSYMGSLSHIPLFDAKQEIETAKNIETLEISTWLSILELPEAQEMMLKFLEGSKSEHAPKLAKNIIKIYKLKHPAKKFDQLGLELKLFDLDGHFQQAIFQNLNRIVLKKQSQSKELNRKSINIIKRKRNIANRARNNFVRANLRLVISVARKFNTPRVPFIDLIQEGNVGLMKAVRRFEYRKGFRFSTYAHWWIRQGIERSIMNKGVQIRVPVHLIELKRKIRRAKTKLTQQLKREPTLEEISEKCGETPAKVEEMLLTLTQDAISLDSNIGDSDNRSFVDLLEDDKTKNPEENLGHNNENEQIRQLLEKLNPIEKDIIRRRFGMGNDQDQTLDEIGKVYNLSRERVRQIQYQGLQKMKRMCKRRKIGNG